MIIGIGFDLVERARIHKIFARYGEHFARRLLHPQELAAMPKAPAAAVDFLASRFAVKEAGVKALGTGFSQGIGMHDVTVRSLPNGKPCLELYGKALERMNEMGATVAHISLSHARDVAGAVVILERLSPTPTTAQQEPPC